MKWWPKFSTVDLLWLTVAVALGFAISQSPEPDKVEFFIYAFSTDNRWADGFQAAGCVLLVVALFQHGRRVHRLADQAPANERTALHCRTAVSYLWALGTSLLLLLQLLVNRHILPRPNSEHAWPLWARMWPDLLITIAALVALRFFLHARAPAATISWKQRCVHALCVVGAVVLAAWLLIDQATVAMLVHNANKGIEFAEPGWLHREGVFPHHASEGYWSFWTAVAAAAAALLGAALLTLLAQSRNGKHKSAAWFTLVCVVVALAAYDWWFVYYEFPRIDPDMASILGIRHWSDTLGGLLLWGGFACWLALVSAREGCTSEVPLSGRLVAMGAILVTLAQAAALSGSFHLVFRMNSVFVPASWWVGLQTLAGMLISPETLLPLLVLASALALLWQSIRRPNATKVIFPIFPRRFGYFALAWAALLAVAVPAFWAFALCYWLGPLVL